MDSIDHVTMCNILLDPDIQVDTIWHKRPTDEMHKPWH